MQEDSKILGGELIALSTPDHIKLDSVYFNAQQFRNKLKSAGCTIEYIETQDENNEIHQLQAIKISQEDYANSGKEVIQALKSFHAFAGNLDRKILKKEQVGQSYVMEKIFFSFAQRNCLIHSNRKHTLCLQLILTTL